MPVNVREERVEWTAVDKSLTSVTNQAKNAVTGLRSSIDTVKNALAAVGVTVGAGAMIQLYHDTLKAVAALDDMAESTGSSVENLSRMQQVARIGGHDFDGLTQQIGRMVKGLKGADEEGQNAGRALQFLDVKSKDANGRFRDTGDILFDVAKKLARYEDGGNKVALVQDLLGKGAERYLPMLKDMAEHGDVQANVTARQAAEAEKAEKAINGLRLAMEQNRRELVINYIPALNEWLEKLSKASRATGGPVAGAAFLAMRTGASPEGMSGADIEARIAEIDRQMAGHDAAIEGSQGGQGLAGRFLNWTGGVGRAMSGYSIGRLMQERSYLEQYRPRAGKATELADWMEPGPASTLNYQSQGRAGADKDGRLTPEKIAQMQLEGQAAFSEQIQKWQHDQIEYTDALRKQAEAYKDLIDPARKYAEEQAILNRLVAQGLLTQEEAVQVQRKLLEARTKVEELGESAKLAGEAGHSLGLSFASAMDRIAFDSSRGVHAMDLLRAAAMDVAKVIYGRTVINPASAALERGIADWFRPNPYASGSMTSESAGMVGQWLHSGGMAGGAGDYRQVHPAYFESARRFHSGGLVPGEVPAILQRGEEVLTRRDPRHRMNGGGSDTYYIDARGADQAAIARLENMIVSINGSIERRAVAASREDRRR